VSTLGKSSPGRSSSGGLCPQGRARQREISGKTHSPLLGRRGVLPTDDSAIIAHIDDDRTNNHASNLKWSLAFRADAGQEWPLTSKRAPEEWTSSPRTWCLSSPTSPMADANRSIGRKADHSRGSLHCGRKETSEQSGGFVWKRVRTAQRSRHECVSKPILVAQVVCKHAPET
jgi:hypothetical protein